MIRLVFKAVAIACALAGLSHALLGVGGDWIVGVTPASPINPSLDSQNRFYGGVFLVYAVLLWIGASDLRRYAPVLRALFAVMFVAGCARGLAAAAHGWPTAQIMALWASEILLPPLFWLWLTSELTKPAAGSIPHKP